MSVRRRTNKTRTVAAQIEVAVPQELVDFLRKKHPQTLPKIDQTEREIFVEVGWQQCINYLETLVNRKDRAARANRQVTDEDGRT